MIELFGFELGTVFQGGTLAAMLALVAIVARVYILGMPERRRVANEGRVIDNEDAARRFKDWRDEVHDLKNDLQIVTAMQAKCDKHLVEAETLNRHVLFLIRLLISDAKRHDPESVLVKRAEETLAHILAVESTKSTALTVAEGAVQDAKQTLASTQETRDEVKRSENGNEPHAP